MFDFGIIWYNDPSIIRLLDSLPAHIPKTIIDGKFQYLKDIPELSEPELRHRVLTYPNVTLIDAPNLTEPEKRQLYLDTDSKAIFIIDSDEWVSLADWSAFERELDSLDFGIHLVNFDVDNRFHAKYPRVWINPKDWKYVDCHNVFENTKANLSVRSNSYNGYTFTSIRCAMNDDLRSPEYTKKIDEYQKWLEEYERPLRKRLF